MTAQAALPRWRGFKRLGFFHHYRPGPIRRRVIRSPALAVVVAVA